MSEPVREECGCGQPGTPDTVHRVGGPCYSDETGEVQRDAAMALVTAGFTAVSAVEFLHTGQPWRLVRRAQVSDLRFAIGTVVARALAVRAGDAVVIGLEGGDPVYPGEVLAELGIVCPGVRFAVVAQVSGLDVAEKTEAPELVRHPPPQGGDPLVDSVDDARYWIGVLHRRTVRDAEDLVSIRDRLGELERTALRRLIAAARRRAR